MSEYTGLYRGVVVDTTDPQHQRRVKLSVPQVMGSEVTDWAWHVESAGMHIAPPKIGQGVWVQFIGGDLGYPVWHGEFGKHQDTSRVLYISPIAGSVSLSGVADLVITQRAQDGTTEVDVAKTIVALANAVVSLRSRVTALEAL